MSDKATTDAEAKQIVSICLYVGWTVTLSPCYVSAFQSATALFKKPKLLQIWIQSQTDQINPTLVLEWYTVNLLMTKWYIRFTASFVEALFNCFLTGIGLTGLYVNPANAFIQSWGLGDVSSLSHICVYWLGPFCGVWLSVQFERWLAGPVAETHSSLIFQSFKVLRSTTATQTVQEAAVLTETNSSTSSSLRDLPQNVGPCGPSSSKFDSHSVEHENSSDGFTNKFGLLGLPIS